jgi:hypothetical protein
MRWVLVLLAIGCGGSTGPIVELETLYPGCDVHAAVSLDEYQDFRHRQRTAGVSVAIIEYPADEPERAIVDCGRVECAGCGPGCECSFTKG